MLVLMAFDVFGPLSHVLELVLVLVLELSFWILAASGSGSLDEIKSIIVDE